MAAILAITTKGEVVWMRRNAVLACLVASACLSSLTPSARAASGPELTVSVTVDKAAAKPDQLLRYHIRVENVGDEPAAGPIQVTSHIPEQTSHAPSEDCPVDEAEECFQIDVPTPGLGDGAHQVSQTVVRPLAPAAGFTVVYRVRINQDAAVGSHVRNHAHVSATNLPEVTSAPVDTLIVDRLPNAAFGGSLFASSGGLTTDSFDSIAGSYAMTAMPSAGSIASNGDITVAGGSLIQGDATPGPGHSTTVSNNSTVTGSTSPAADLVQLNDVDSTPYAVTNDNVKLCLLPESCTGVTYDDGAKILTITGSASLLPGAYYLCRLEVKGGLSISGSVSVWIGSPSACGTNGGVTFEKARVTVESGRTGDFQVLVHGGDAPGLPVRVTATSSVAAAVYSPTGAFKLEGESDLFGVVTAGQVNAGAGGARFHFDRALAQ